LSDHLTLEQIEHYVRRAGSVDEILAAAEHLEQCDDCRDLASGLVTLETTVEGAGRLGHAAAAAQSRRRAALWIAAAVIALVVLAWFVLRG
jgi:alkylhydroperoxidase family enzyme